jgi:hypothetical protein
LSAQACIFIANFGEDHLCFRQPIAAVNRKRAEKFCAAGKAKFVSILRRANEVKCLIAPRLKPAGLSLSREN